MPLTTSELDSDGLAGFNLMDYNQGILNGLKNSSGQQIALPYDFGPLMVFYNKTEFLKYKVPLPTHRLDLVAVQQRRRLDDEEQRRARSMATSTTPTWTSSWPTRSTTGSVT